MIIQADETGEVSILDATNFNQLKITLPRGLAREHEEGALAEFGKADGEHVWVDPQWLRDRGPQDAQWREGLERMLGYAASKGWLDGAGRARVHVERT